MKPGDQVGQYTLLKELGHGGMGGVFVGFDSEKVALVAVKTLFEEYSSDEVYVRRFLREVDVLAKLDHPNVVHYIDSGVYDRVHYIVLEHIRGKDLGQILQTQKRFSVQETLSILELCTSGLGHSHSKGIVHRDIKPSNIMLTDDGRVPKIVDFGVAYADDAILQTATGDIVGTFMYSSPEQNQGKEVDERSDLYALGLVFYELLTGKRALEGTSHQEVTTIQLTCQIAPPSHLFSGIPIELDNIVLKLLSYSADDRYQTTEDLLFDLEMFKSDPKALGKSLQSINDYPEYLEDFKKAAAAYQAKNYDLATSIATDLCHKAHKASEVYFLLGQVQYQNNFLYNAIKEFKKAIVFAPENIHYHHQLALTYEGLGMSAQAAQSYTAMLEIDPDSQIALDGLSGEAAIREEQYEAEAEQAEEESEVLPPMISEADSRVFKKRLMRNLKAFVNPLNSVLASLFFWGAGHMSLDDNDRTLKYFGLEIIFLVIPILLFVLSPVDFGLSLDEVPLSVFQGAGAFLLMTGAYILFQNLSSVNERTILFNQQGYVIESDVDRLLISICIGSSRGVTLKSKFGIFQQRTPEDETGFFIGEMRIDEVRTSTAMGKFLPRPGEMARIGDFVVAKQAAKQKIISVENPDKNRFIEMTPDFYDRFATHKAAQHKSDS